MADENQPPPAQPQAPADLPQVMPILRLRLMQIINATSDPLEVARLSAGCLAQASNRPLPAPDATIDSCLRSIAQVVPSPFTLADTLPAAVTTVMRQSAEAFGGVTALPAPGITPASTTLVETPADRTERERYVTIHRCKFMRNVEGTFSVFYAHLWVGRTYEAWLGEWRALGHGLVLPELHSLKHDCLLRVVKAWFAWTSEVRRVEDISEQQLSLFSAQAEVAAELYLLMVNTNTNVRRLAASCATATSVFAASVRKRQHDRSIAVNFFQEITDACAAKDPVGGRGPFRN
jgi:hypothetical protein